MKTIALLRVGNSLLGDRTLECMHLVVQLCICLQEEGPDFYQFPFHFEWGKDYINIIPYLETETLSACTWLCNSVYVYRKRVQISINFLFTLSGARVISI